MSDFSAKGRSGFIAGLSVLIIGTGAFHLLAGAIDAVLRKEPVLLRATLSTIPSALGRWRQVGADQILSPEVVEELGTPNYLTRSYIRTGEEDGGRIDFHVAYYTGMIDAVPHIPERCNLGSGLEKAPAGRVLPLSLSHQTWSDPLWSDIPEPIRPSHPDAMTRTLLGETVRLPRPDSGEHIRVNVTQYWHPSAPEQRFCTGYFFVANGRTTPFATGVKSLAFRLSERSAYYCKIQISYFAPQRATDEAELARVASEFLSDALPEIMRCLPDWNQVLLEQWESEVSTAGTGRSVGSDETGQ